MDITYWAVTAAVLFLFFTSAGWLVGQIICHTSPYLAIPLIVLWGVFAFVITVSILGNM